MFKHESTSKPMNSTVLVFIKPISGLLLPSSGYKLQFLIQYYVFNLYNYYSVIFCPISLKFCMLV